MTGDGLFAVPHTRQACFRGASFTRSGRPHAPDLSSCDESIRACRLQDGFEVRPDQIDGTAIREPHVRLDKPRGQRPAIEFLTQLCADLSRGGLDRQIAHCELEHRKPEEPLPLEPEDLRIGHELRQADERSWSMVRQQPGDLVTPADAAHVFVGRPQRRDFELVLPAGNGLDVSASRSASQWRKAKGRWSRQRRPSRRTQ